MTLTPEEQEFRDRVSIADAYIAERNQREEK